MRRALWYASLLAAGLLPGCGTSIPPRLEVRDPGSGRTYQTYQPWGQVEIQENKGLGVWKREFTKLRLPDVYNLRSDPFGRADESGLPFDTSNQLYFTVPGQAVVGKWLGTFKEFPPRQKPASFNVDEVMSKLTEVNRGAN